MKNLVYTIDNLLVNADELIILINSFHDLIMGNMTNKVLHKTWIYGMVIKRSCQKGLINE